MSKCMSFPLQSSLQTLCRKKYKDTNPDELEYFHKIIYTAISAVQQLENNINFRDNLEIDDFRFLDEIAEYISFLGIPEEAYDNLSIDLKTYFLALELIIEEKRCKDLFLQWPSYMLDFYQEWIDRIRAQYPSTRPLRSNDEYDHFHYDYLVTIVSTCKEQANGSYPEAIDLMKHHQEFATFLHKFS